MALIQLIYVSSITDMALESEIGKILETSIRRNSEDNITGLLLYGNGNFMQALEGEEKAVLNTFERIKADSRHHCVYKLYDKPIEERDFAQWSMGYRYLEEKDLQAIPECQQFFKYHNHDPAIEARPGLALKILRQFSDYN